MAQVTATEFTVVLWRFFSLQRFLKGYKDILFIKEFINYSPL